MPPADARMNALILDHADAPFRLTEVDHPRPGKGEVLVRIHASGVNPLDTKIRAGVAAHARHPLPAILGIVIGALSFGSLSVNATKALLGGISVAFSIYQLIPALRDLKTWLPEWLRPWLWCGLSGFTSTLAHAGGPPITIYLWPKKIDRMQFMAITVVFFTVVNAVKLIPFAILGQLSLSNLATSLVLMPFAPVGVWLGVRLNNVINDVIFRRVTLACLSLLGVRLLYEGLK